MFLSIIRENYKNKLFHKILKLFENFLLHSNLLTFNNTLLYITLFQHNYNYRLLLLILEFLLFAPPSSTTHSTTNSMSIIQNLKQKVERNKKKSKIKLSYQTCLKNSVVAQKLRVHFVQKSFFCRVEFCFYFCDFNIFFRYDFKICL